jgi:hypothetical protein
VAREGCLPELGNAGLAREQRTTDAGRVGAFHPAAAFPFGIRIAIASLTILACTNTSVSSPMASLQATTEGPMVECLGGVDQPTCDGVLQVALAAVKSSGWTPAHVWISDGLLAPIPNLLFDPTANFPYPLPPDDGQWVANAEIAFAETDQHAGMNVASVPGDLRAVLIGYAVPPLEWCSGECPTSTTTDGPFRLELVFAHLDWRTTDPISGTAILSVAGPAPTNISGSGHSLIVFSYVEAGGMRRVDPIASADCKGYTLDPTSPIKEPLSKSGAIGTDFQRSFFAGPDVKLPPGTWDITAIAGFDEGLGCSRDTSHEMKVAARLTVSQ